MQVQLSTVLRNWEIKIQELEGIDEEVQEEDMHAMSSTLREEARRVLQILPRPTSAPVMHLTDDGDLAIEFRSLAGTDAVLIELCKDGQAACFSYTGGRSRRARYQDSSEIPDQFVLAQLAAISS